MERKAIIEFKDFTAHYTVQSKPTLNNINLTIYEGEKVLIAGPSGSGKSTLANCINGLIPFSTDIEISGSLKIKGKETKDLSVFEISKMVGTVLQDPDSQFIVDDVDILLFDEPLASLDPAAGKASIELIDKIQKEEKKTVIIIEHRLEEVLNCDVDRIILMNEGEIIADTTPNEILASNKLKECGIREPLYITALKYSGYELNKEMNLENIDKLKLSDDGEKLKTWYKSLNFNKKEREEDTLLEFKNVSFKYPRSKEFTLKNISIKINEGEKLSVVGLNGAGKTTFIKLLARLYDPTEGEILLNGVNINEYDYDEYMKLLSVVFQDFKLMSFSIKENIALNDFNKVKDEEIEEVLIKSGFGKDLEKLPKGINTPIYKNFDEGGIEFSGGQAQKLAIARAVYKDAPIVILDEPTAALDPKAEYEIYSKFNELIGKKTTIYISHRLSSCRFCDNIAVFQKGKLIQYGTHDELVKDKGNEYETMYSAQAQYYV